MLASILLACCACAFASSPSLDISQYAHTAWRVRDGFFKSGINAIAQTPDGYLWLGTEFGLLRFDGVRSVPWQPPPGQPLPSSTIWSLLAARDGTLWIGTFQGLASWNDGKLTQYPELAGLGITSLLADAAGTVWAGAQGTSTGRLCAIQGGRVRCSGEDGSLRPPLWSLLEDRRGNLWAGVRGGIWRWKPGPPKFHPMPDTVQALIESNNGSLLIATPAGLKQLVDGKVKPYLSDAAGRRRFNTNCLLRDRDGELWIGTVGQGILHVHDGRTDVFAQSDGLSGDFILRLFEDREGSVWVATANGLDRFHRFSVPTLSVKQGLSSPDVLSVLAARDRSIWLGTTDGLDRWKNGQITIYRRRSSEAASDEAKAKQEPAVREVGGTGLPDETTGSLFEDHRGRIWISTLRGIAYFENGRFTTVSAVPAAGVYSFAGDRAGNLWISQTQGLLHLREKSVVERIPWDKLGHKDFAWTLLSDPSEGGVWLGFRQGGVAYFQDGQVRASHGTGNGLGEGVVNDLLLDADDTLWAATEGGLSRLKDGHVATLTSRNGLPCDTVNWVKDDDTGSFWLYMACGLVRIARPELDAWAADSNRTIRTTVLDSSDGVRSHPYTTSWHPLVARGADGRLWFLPFDGVSVLDPHHLAFNKLPPPVDIEQVTADDKTYDATNGLRLPPHIRYLTIDYTALSLVVPEKVRFRVKLEGQDKDWRELVNVRHVEYTNLPPKRYRFRVLACNNSGVWNEEGAALDFVIPPAWYQTNWFRAACVAAFLAMIWGIYELRVRQLAAQFNMRLEERVSERSRIARDLHDTLLQSFQGLVFRFQAARYQLPDRPKEASDALDSALISADQAIAEGRSAIQELRSRSSEESNLEHMLLAMGRELAASQNGGDSAPPLRVIVEGNRRAKRAMIREEIYRIARELLRNAYRHAHAKSIEAELRYDDDAFLLIVRDDGKGIDPKVLKDRGRAGHWGLPGMYERVEGIGARLDIWSEAGAGTEVRLTVPAAIAYEKSGDRGRFKLFRKTRIYEHRS
ncbi:MAG: two-component regulator propeller domain-containing protein [Candidatus Sulfotelmatobacter sp.]